MNESKQKIKSEFYKEASEFAHTFGIGGVMNADATWRYFEKKLDDYAEEMCNQQREMCAKRLEDFKFASSSENANKVFGALHQSMIEACKNAPSPSVTKTHN